MSASELQREIQRTTRAAFQASTEDFPTRAPVSIFSHIGDSNVSLRRTWGRRLFRYDTVKRCFDFVSSVGLITFTAPAMLVVASIVRFSSPGPILIRQRRLTSGGRVFTMYKFRTMCDHAERNTGPVWASKLDPRVTPIGRVLRRTRLDELPQFFNVLRGDMSLVGPRPERPELAVQLIEQFPNFRRRMEVKAGMTGLAQVTNGYAAESRSYRNKLRLDITYVDNRSFLLDLQIIARTFSVVFSGLGAR